MKFIILMLMTSIVHAQQWYDPDIKPIANPIFKQGQNVSCIIETVKAWQDGTEFIEPSLIQCTVLKIGIVSDDEYWGDNYANLYVDCSKGYEADASGIVTNHKLNYTKRWMTTRECYKL